MSDAPKENNGEAVKSPVSESLNAELSSLEAEAAPDQTVIDKPIVPAVDYSKAKAEFLGALKMVLTPIPDIVCPNWNIQAVEMDALCDAYAEAAAQQWPAGMGEMGPWAGAILMTAVVIGPRVSKPRKLPQKVEKEVRDSGNSQD